MDLSFSIKEVIKKLGTLFEIWTQKFEEGWKGKPPKLQEYLKNLSSLLARQKGSRRPNQTESRLNYLTYSEKPGAVFAFLTLAFSDKPEKYEFFYKKFKDIPLGKKFFSAVASLFPWKEEETWALIRRAENSVLKVQGAKFIPELVQYAILLCTNPTILEIENNLTERDLEFWKYLLIPLIQLVMYSHIEKKIQKYVETRPLAYVTTPRYYRRYGYRYRHRRHSRLHYHRVG